MVRRHRIRHQLMFAIANRIRLDVTCESGSRPSVLVSGVPVEIVALRGSASRVVIDPGEKHDGTCQLIDLDCIEHVRQARLGY